MQRPSHVLDAAMLRVRTGKHYPYKFNVLLGQRNVEFVSGPVQPHVSAKLPHFMRLHKLQGLAVVEPGYDLLHFKNAIPVFHNKPYVMTFEDYLPRVPEDYYNEHVHRFLWNELAKSRCRRIVAQSRYAVRQFTAQNGKMDNFDQVREKLCLIRPAIDVRASAPKPRRPTVNLLFVGEDFLRKGGPAVTRAHEMLKASRVQVETTIISSFRYQQDDYVAPPGEAINQREADRAATSGMRLLGSMPYAQVMDEMAKADFLVLPTLHDTFGFVTIEAMSRGTPVIATDTCAIPEVVEDGRNGWLLPFENDPVIGRWVNLYDVKAKWYPDVYMAAIEKLAAHIHDVVVRWLDEGAEYEALSDAAIQIVRRGFSVTHARDRLEQIYAAAAA
jgi:glycosyltransferase involved in cell wall biosynthesis